MRLDDPHFHELKIWPEYFEAVKDGSKKFEYREDRNYEVGDRLNLREWDPVKLEYTKRAIFVTVTYKLQVSRRMVILSIA